MSTKESVQPVQDTRAERSSPSRNSIVSDTNAERAVQTEALVKDIAPQLGLRVSDMKVFVDEQAASLVGVHGFRGLMSGGAIYLDPKRYQASSTAGRALLAHEMVHVAQRVEWRGLQAGRNVSVHDAEKEADELAHMYAVGHRMRAPVHVLPEGHSAAFEGGAQAAAEVESEEEPVVYVFGDLGMAEASAVEEIFKSEIVRIRDIVSEYEGIGTDEAEEVLRILDNVAPPDALSIMRHITSRSRVSLVESFESEHMARWRSQVIACYASLTKDLISNADHDFFRGMSLRNLSAHEKIMVRKVLVSLEEGAFIKLLGNGGTGAVVRDLMTTPLDVSEEVKAFNDDLSQNYAVQQAAFAEFDDGLVEGALPRADFLMHIIELAKAGNIQGVLSEFNSYANDIGLSVSDVRGRDQAAAQDRLKYVSGEITLSERQDLEKDQRSAYEAERTAAESTEATKEHTPPSEMKEEKEKAERQRLRQREVVLRSIVGQLEHAGIMQKIINSVLAENIYDSDEKPSNFHDQGFLALLRYRPSDRNIALLEQLLYRGIDDWAVRDYEARFAYDVLGQMTQEAQERFKQIRGGLLYSRLISNLPDSYLRRDDFLFLGQEGVQAILSSKPYQFVSQIFEQIISFFEDNCFMTGKEAVAGFYAIIRFETPVLGALDKERDEASLNEAQKDIFRPVLVQRLDALGHIKRLLNNLPEEFLYKEVNWRGLNKILAALDPRSAQNLSRAYLSRPLVSWFDWVVTDRDALLAYQLYRTLPPEQQAEMDGAYADGVLGVITAEMSSDMRSHYALGPYRGRTDPYARVPVLEELADINMLNNVSDEDMLGYYEIRLRLAIAMGYHREVFDISRTMSFSLISEFFPLIEKYKLFHHITRTEYESLEVEGRPWYKEGALQTFETMGGYLLAICYTLARMGLSNSITVRGDLDTLQALMGEGLHFATSGASTTREEPQPQKNRVALPEDTYWGFEGDTYPEESEAVDYNEFKIILDLNNNVIEGEIPALDLSDIYYLSSEKISIERLRLSGLKFNAGFSRGSSEQISFLDLSIASVMLDQILSVGAKNAVGAGGLSVHDISLHAGGTSDLDVQKDSVQYDFINRESAWMKIPILSHLTNGLVLPALNAVWQLLRFAFSGFSTEPMQNDADLIRHMSFEYSDFELHNIVTDSGQSVGKIQSDGGFLAFGGNKPAYLRSHIGMIAHRIERLEKEGGRDEEVVNLSVLKSTLTTELSLLQPKEGELFQLQAKFQNRPNSFTDNDYDTMRSLEQELAMKGGGAVDIENLRIQNIGGPMSADDITITDISGAAETGMAALRLPSYDRLAQDFLRDGYTQASDDVTALAEDAQLGLNLGDVTIKNALMEGEIPTVYTLIKELEALPAGDRYKDRRAHLQAVLVKVMRYESLEKRRRFLARDGIYYLSEVDQEEYNRLRKDLAKEFGYFAEKIYIEDAVIGLPDGQSGVQIQSPRITISGVETHYGDFNGDIILDDFDGTFSMDDEGIHIDRMKIETITLPQFDLYYDGYAFSTKNPVVLSGLFLKMSIPYKDDGSIDTDSFIIHFMNIAKIDVDELTADMEMGGSLFHINLSSGSLHNVWLKNFALKAPNLEELGTQVGVGHFSEFRVKGALENTASFQLTLGDRDEGGGSTFNDVDTPNVSGSAVTVGMVGTSLQTISLQDLVGKEGLFVLGEDPIGDDGRPPRGSNFIRVGHVDIATPADTPIRFNEDGSISGGLISETIVLTQIQWYAAGGKIYSEGPVTLRDVSADFVYGQSEDTPVILNELNIGVFEVQKLLFEKDDQIYGIQTGDALHDQGGEVYNISITNAIFDKDYMPTQLDLSINDVPEGQRRESRVDLFAQLATNQTILSRLWVHEEGQVNLQYRTAGGMEVRLNAEGLYANTRYDDQSTVDERLSIFTTIADLNTGDIVLRDTGSDYIITIGAEDTEGLYLNNLGIDEVLMESPDLDLHMTGGVSFEHINVKLDVTLPKKENETSETPQEERDVRLFSELIIREFSVDKTIASDMKVKFRHQGEDSVNEAGEVQRGKETTGTLELGANGGDVVIFDLGLRGAKPPENFYIEPIVVDIPENEREPGGPVKKVDWMKSIHGIFSTGLIDVQEIKAMITHDGSFYRLGMNSSDIAHPNHPSDWGIVDGNPSLPGILVNGGSEYNFEDESLMLSGVEVSGLQLWSREYGAFLDVRRIAIPQKFSMYLTGDAVERRLDISEHPELVNVIPEIIIEDAYFRINDLSQFMPNPENSEEGGVYGDENNPTLGRSTGDALAKAADLAQWYKTALDGANGHINIDLRGVPVLDDPSIRADVHDGRLLYNDFVSNASNDWLVMKLNPLTRQLILYLEVPSISMLDMMGLVDNDLPLLIWDLSSEEVLHAESSGEVLLTTMMQPRLSSAATRAMSSVDWWNDGDDIEEEEPAKRDYLEITNIDVQLSSNHPTDMQPFVYQNEGNTMSIAAVFDKNMFNNFHITGNLQTIHNSENRVARSFGAQYLNRPGEIQYSMDDLNIDAFSLQMKGAEGAPGSSVLTGPITLRGLTGGRLTFDGYTPQMLEGHILEGKILNLQWLPNSTGDGGEEE